MDLLTYINDDHEIIQKFIKDIDATENLKIKDKIFNEMIVFMKAYFRAIEASLYTKSLRTNIFELTELALDGYEEHHLLEDLIYRINNNKKEEDLKLNRMKDFCQILDLHLTAESTDYYPELKSFFTSIELEKIAVSYLKTKKLELASYEQELSENLYFNESDIRVMNLN